MCITSQSIPVSMLHRCGWIVVVSLLMLLCCTGPVTTQESGIVLTLVLPDGIQFVENAGIFDAFEAAHPGVNVYIRYNDIQDMYFATSLSPLPDYLADIDAYTQTGDVVFTSVGTFMPRQMLFEATRAGYFLDLAPLIQTDPAFDPSGFYPLIWQSVSWDGGTWMLPAGAHVYTPFYNAEAFDAANATYPNEDWTLSDYAIAIEAITPRTADGRAIGPGFIGYNNSERALAYTLIESGLYDENVLPNPPQLDQPEAVAFAEQWATLYADGAIYSREYDYSDEYSPSDTPFYMKMFTHVSFSEDVPVLLPGARASVGVLGFAVSSRTQYPQEAYELLKLLTSDQRVTDAMSFTVTLTVNARPEYGEVEAIENAPYTIRGLSSDDIAMLERALQNAVPYPEVRYYDALLNAVRRIANEGLDARTTLQEAQAQLEVDLAYAEAQRSQIRGFIPTPPPPVVLASGEIALHFRLVGGNGIYGRAPWEAFMQAFADVDSEVGQVVFDTQFASIENTAENYDCFYLPYNAVLSINLNNITSLDPLLDADPSFDREQLLNGVLDSVTRDGHIWGYPLDIRPEALWYDPEALAAADITVPEGGWTMDIFLSMLQQLHAVSEEPVLTAFQPNITLLMLIASAGGLPLDYRTDPVSVNFTDADVEAAIRQILDLAKTGVIAYAPLTDHLSSPGSENAPFYAHTVAADGFFRAGDQVTHYPQGNHFTPVAFDLGTAYISDSAPSPEACYRLIRALAERPDLLMGMPVVRRFAQVEDVMAVQSQDIRAFYDQLEARLTNPNTIGFPFGQAGTTTDFAATYWLLRAFDHYVLDDADLTAELVDAELLTQAYLNCVAALPPFDTSRQQVRDYNLQVIDCAVQVDPPSESYFRLS